MEERGSRLQYSRMISPLHLTHPPHPSPPALPSHRNEEAQVEAGTEGIKETETLGGTGTGTGIVVVVVEEEEEEGGIARVLGRRLGGAEEAGMAVDGEFEREEEEGRMEGLKRVEVRVRQKKALTDMNLFLLHTHVHSPSSSRSRSRSPYRRRRSPRYVSSYSFPLPSLLLISPS
jgi:hypothetical protein